MDHLLVTGGCGFIGSNFIRRILSTREDVVILNLDALTYAGNPANLAEFADHPNYEFLHGDITDVRLVRRVMRRNIRWVVHLAAESHVDRSIEDPAPFIRTNILGTQILIEAARTFEVERFLQVSTDEVYGSLGPTGAFDESSPIAPNSPYAASKAGGDLLVQAAVHTHDFPAIITRCSNNYGPYQFPEKLIPLFIRNLIDNRPVPVYGDGLQVRDWLHVQDHCAALEAVLFEGQLGEVYNIGGRCEWTNLELTQRLLELMNKPSSLIRHVSDRPGHDRRYAIECGKIERELGWRPRIVFEDGLRETVQWYLSNRCWLDAVCSGAYRSLRTAQNLPAIV